jgi:predicted RNase H-related nuclease YkuK (DUF458 family)
MNDLKELNWFSGVGNIVPFDSILQIIEESVQKGSKIFIGSDSFISKRKVNFATAICIHGPQQPGRYFFAREILPKTNYNVLVTRITEEVRRSVELAEYIMETNDIESENIELHIDVSPFNMNNGTSRFSDMLRGYVTGAGFECRVKPNAWASQTVADKHSK